MGTGSILIACTYFGGICFGSDLDIRVVRGYRVGRKNKNFEGDLNEDKFNVFTNFRYYGLPSP